MNNYSELLRYIKQLADADPYISTVTNKGFVNTDEFISNLYPLFDVVVTGASYPSTQMKQFDVTLSCLAPRDINPEVTNDKFFGNDNEIDNLNETEACLNRIWLIMNRDFPKNNIVATADPDLDIILEEKENVLDGWSMSISVITPNTSITLCS
jgi:hypothetical protein